MYMRNIDLTVVTRERLVIFSMARATCFYLFFVSMCREERSYVVYPGLNALVIAHYGFPRFIAEQCFCDITSVAYVFLRYSTIYSRVSNTAAREGVLCGPRCFLEFSNI